MGFLDEIKKLARPYDDDEEEFDDFSAKAPEQIPVTPNRRPEGSPRQAREV